MLDTVARPGAVFLCGLGALFPEELRPLGDTLEAWIESGWSLRDPEGERFPERIDLYLMRPPAGGLKAMARIMKRLGLTTPMSAFREIVAATPYRLMHDVPHLPAARYAAELNREDNCLGVTEVGQPDRAVPPWPAS